MSTVENKAKVRRLSEMVNSGNLDGIVDLFDTSYVFHTTPEIRGAEEVKRMFSNMLHAFPDYEETIEHMVAEGELVAVFYTLRGTFKNVYGNMEPTGKRFTVSASVLARFRDGRQVEAWEYLDQLSWYQQMGIDLSKVPQLAPV